MSDYRWIQKSAIIDIIRGEMQRQGNLSNEQIAKVSYDSGVSEGAIKEWLFGATRKPLEISTRYVIEALGVTINYTRSDGTNIRKAQDEMMSMAARDRVLRAERERERLREKQREKEKKK